MRTLDPITLEVLQNKFDVIADEMEIALLRSSYSPVVKEGLDASSALFTVKGEVIAQAASIPIHLGCLLPSVERLLVAFPAEQMAEGDAFIMNDPYDGGTHLPDTTIIQPILYEGRTVALCATMTHNQDIGGKTPGSTPTDATDIFQEGFCIPPLKFYDRGRPNEVLHALLRKNVRLPDVLMGDMHGQMAAGMVGMRRMQELLDEYGPALVTEAVAQLMNRAEALTREKISAIPDGSYAFTDYLDNDGVELERPVKIHATVTVKGSNIHFDFTGTSAQAKGPINSVASSTISGGYYAIRAISGPLIPNNSGCYRPISFTLPEGSLVNPRHPAPVNARAITIFRIADVLQGALVQAMPGQLTAGHGGPFTGTLGGIDPRSGKPYVTHELGTGGIGARPNKDGIDVLDFGPVNCMNIPLEATELSQPLRIRKYHLRRDSGGAGRWRGGLGSEKTIEATGGEVRISLRGERFFTGPWGLHGGRAGSSARAWIERRDGTREEIRSKRVFTLNAGERVHIHTAGGGGYGDPLAREPERVRHDVLDRKVSPQQAESVYGVVLIGEGLQVDAEATARRRGQAGSGEHAPLLFDHGRDGGSEQGLAGLAPPQ
jgi:N-methylhydantoinase B